MRTPCRAAVLGIFLLAAGWLAGCAHMGASVFVHPDYDFNGVERVAVVPFENLTSDQGAAYRATRYFVSDLLAMKAFEVIEPGEVARALEKSGAVRTAELTQEQILAIGKDLGAQGLFLGSIGESGGSRSGAGTSANVVTLVVRMVETEQGSTVWSATNTEGGRSFWGSVMGTGERSQSEVTRRCVRHTLETLIR